MDIKNISETFCPYPFVQASCTNRGNARICCRSVISKERHPHDEKNFSKVDFSTVFNNSYMREVRKKMLKGERSEACGRCYVEEDVGSFSRRQMEIRRVASYSKEDLNLVTARVQEAIDNDGVVQQAPMNYDLHYGNKCNSKCRTCWPAASHVLLKEVQELKSEGATLPRHTEGEYQDLKESPNFWSPEEKLFDYLQQNTGPVRRLQIAGGETLLIKPFFKSIDRFIEDKIESKIDIELVTNLTIYDLDLWYKLKAFRHVDLLCSIDGVGDVNDYIRYPSRWPKIEKNFLNLVHFFKDDASVDIYLQATVSNINIFYITDLVDWISNLNIPRSVGININHVHTPEFYKISIMPKALRERVQQKISAWLETFKPNESKSSNISNMEFVYSRIQSYLKIIETPEEDSSLLFQEFSSFTKLLDGKRGQRGEELLPEIRELFLDEST